jgi:site-specific DNA-methyltransferase (cytosine-N4-specific)
LPLDDLALFLFRDNPELYGRRLSFGTAICADSLLFIDKLPESSVDLVFTSPPFPLIKKKKYGNVGEEEYVDWILKYCEKFKRVLKDSGSLVIDLGSAWLPGKPVRSLYEMRFCLKMVDDLGFNLCQDFYWWNPSRLPTPAQWVTVKRVRAKDAINRIYWFSKSENPKADNKKVLQPYTKRMREYMASDPSEHHRRPSGHKPSSQFRKDNGGSIPPNILAAANTGAREYQIYCRENNLTPHPARFPYEIPEFFIDFLSEPGDLVLDPFAGSCTTGVVAEEMGRHWINIEINKEYITGMDGHLQRKISREPKSYSIFKVGSRNTQC